MLTGANTYTGGTTIGSGAAVQIGDGGTSGSVGSGSIHDNGSLSVNRSDAVTLGQVIDGTGSLTQAGAGTTILTGANSYTGATNVTAGTLQVDGDQSAATGATTVASGATLSGAGKLGGDVSIGDGATLSPGDAGKAPGTLTVGGNLSLANGSTQNWNIGQANVAGGQYNDLVDVKGDLALGGTLNVASVNGGPSVSNSLLNTGVYRIYSYGGSLSGAQNEKLGSIQADSAASFGLQTSIAHQVNLIVNASSVQFWNGGQGGNSGSGGTNNDGTWSAMNGAGDGNWGNADGTQSSPWNSGSYAVFQGDAGTVTISDKDSNGNPAPVEASGMQFANTDGKTYVVTGDDLYASNSTTVIRVGDGTSAGASITGKLDTVINDSKVPGGTSLEKTDAGTLIITKDQNYKGSTTIDGGTIQLGDGGTTGRLPDGTAIHNNGSLVIDHSDEVDLGQTIDGTGSLTQKGTGLTTLGDNNSYSGGTLISGGTLKGSTTSFGSGDIQNNAALIIDQDNDGVFGNKLDGDGSLLKTGTGMVSINRDDSGYTGDTTIQKGGLEVNGSLAGSDIDVKDGGTLAGLGTVGGVIVENGGKLAPGNPNTVGTLTVNRDLDMQAGSTLYLKGTGNLTGSQITTGGSTYDQLQSDRIQVAGAANLSGGTVDFRVIDGSIMKMNQGYTLVTAAGGVSGQFANLQSNITQNYLFLNPSLVYGPNDVNLVLSYNGASLSVLGGGVNQTEVEHGLEGISGDNPIMKGIAQLDQNDGRKALNSLSGEAHASVSTMLTEDSFFTREAVLDRLDAADCDGGYDRGSIRTASLHNKNFKTDGQCYKDRFVLWGESYGSLGRNYGNGNAASMNHTTAGFIMGGDAPVMDTWRVGGMFGYDSSTFDIGSGRSSHGHSNNVTVGAYAGNHWGNLNLRMGVSYAWNMLQTNRTVAFKGYQGSRLNSGYMAGTAQAFGELGYKMHAGTTVVEPFAQVAYVNAHTNRFHETGGIEALRGRSTNNGVTFSTFGFRSATTFKAKDMLLTPQMQLGYRHAFGHLTPSVREMFETGTAGNTMNIAGVALASDVAVVNAGLDIKATDRIDFGISYIGQYGVKSMDNGARAHVKVSF